MYTEVGKIEKAKDFIQKMADGINPLNGEQVHHDSLFNDAGMIRGFYFVVDVLDQVARSSYGRRNKNTEFIITSDQKRKVVFPEGKIGINEFARCINACLNPAESKRLTGVELNKRLRKLGILSGADGGEGKTRTIINEKSAQYGFVSEGRKYNGVEYDMILLNHVGKKYLLDNIETIMAVELQNS